jgi:hypothetical protein
MRAYFEELLQERTFQIPEAYGMDAVIEKNRESACFGGGDLFAAPIAKKTKKQTRITKGRNIISF